MAEANYSIKATIEANAKKFKSAIQAAKTQQSVLKALWRKSKTTKLMQTHLV